MTLCFKMHWGRVLLNLIQMTSCSVNHSVHFASYVWRRVAWDPGELLELTSGDEAATADRIADIWVRRPLRVSGELSRFGRARRLGMEDL